MGAIKSMQNTTEIIVGFKATDSNIQCRGYQFEIGKWHEAEGDLELCANGFHFCEYPSGPWCYYTAKGTRLWKVEAREVVQGSGPGADLKHVARFIRLVEEIKVDGDGNSGDSNTGHSNTGHRNTGDRNTGDSNTGHWNTGDSNTGHRNTGHRNTGDRNTGHRNTGDRNTGHWNTGDWNTGHWNTGDWNTGHRNTGDWNTGDWNTGDWNTGDWNATNYSAGYFCANEPSVICFDVDSGLSHAEFSEKFNTLAWQLGQALQEDDAIDFAAFSSLPGITLEKLQVLHDKMKAARRTKAGAQ